jgi:prolipoprotein diacylglyceryltransferase
MLTLLYSTWDPSKGIEIGSFTLHYYSLMFVLAFGLAIIYL